jgi:AraC-like DNA-binding protein
VRRFQKARDLVRTVATPDWSRVAATVGYYDQSHLIRDFQALSGLSPADYFRRSSRQILPNHALHG